MRERPPMIQTIKSSEAKQTWSKLLNRVFRREARVVVEKNGIPVAALISPEDLKLFERLEAERDRDLAAIERLSEAFKDVPPEEIEREVARAVAEVRKGSRRQPAHRDGDGGVGAQLTDQERETLVAVLKRHGVERAAIFGSFARGNATAESDIDILIEPPESMSLFGHVGLKHDLEDTLGRKVDLVTYAALDPRLKDAILADEIRVL